MINEIHADAQARMDQALEHIRQELASLRTGRANPRMVDHIKIDYYGSLQPLKTLANISVPEPRLLIIEPYDKSQIVEVEKANNDGNVLRLQIPELTEERRRELVKLAHEMVEEGKVSVRNIRRDANQALKDHAKSHEISEDNLHRALDNFQELTDAHIKLLDELQQVKEEEILND